MRSTILNRILCILALNVTYRGKLVWQNV